MSDIRVVVTGASSGIGRATVELLIEAGIEVVAASRRIEKLADLKYRCVLHPCDVTDPYSCAHLVEFAQTGRDRRPVIVNSAGIASFGPFAEDDAELRSSSGTEDFDIEVGKRVARIEGYTKQVLTNLVGPMHVCHAAIPWMCARGGGQIVNVVSIAATHPFAGAAAYCASKAGLLMFGKAIAEEYKDRGIRVTSLLPGATDTPLWDSQSSAPDRADMLSTRAVAERICEAILSPSGESYEEIVLLPPKGIL
jgi:3-oxoacyl-[acyl-carrier protein] reductase